MTDMLDESEIVNISKLNKGQIKRRQLHKREAFHAKIADIIADHDYMTGGCYNVIEIVITLVQPFQLINGVIIQKLASFGILTRQHLPKLPSGVIFTPMGKATVDYIEYDEPMQLTPEELDRCQKFHRFLFENVIRTRKDIKFTENESTKYYLVIPLRQNRELQHDLIKSCITFVNSTTSPSSQACKEVIAEFPHQVIVRPKYSRRKGSWMLVRKITDVTPMSEFHDLSIAETFYDYYKNRYGINIADREQKLICLRGIPNHNSMLKKLHKILNLTSKSKISPHFVPELLDVHPLSACRFLTAICLPSVLFRMESLLSADELRLKIAQETGLGLKDDNIDNSLVPLTRDASTYYVKSIGKLPHVYHQVNTKSSHKLAKFRKEVIDTCKGSIRNETKSVHGKWKRNPESSKELVLKHCRKLRKDINTLAKKTRKWLQIVPISVTKRLFPTFRRHVFNRRSKSRRNKRIISKPGPTVSMLLQALTSLSANDFFNHERLEILGDSYLKFATTADYYHRHPDMKESTMSQMRANNVSNLHLSNTSKVKGLTIYQFNTPFKLKQWIPPGYTPVENKIVQPIVDCANDDKQDHGQSYQQIMSVKNISDTVEGLVGVYSLASGPINAAHLLPWIGLDIDPKSLINTDKMTINESPVTEDDIKLSNCITRVTGYQFNNFRWLRLAFTHSSFAGENYQRLEHLGDAILEYLLIEFVYCRKPYFGPGKISYCKSLMTCNRTFAIICIALQLHMHIRCDSRLKLDILDNVKAAEEILLSNDKSQYSEDSANVEHLSNLTYQLYKSYPNRKLSKICADIFEALVAAIYLDCGKNLNTVWKVVYKIAQRILADILKDAGGLTDVIDDMFPNRIKYQTIKSGNTSIKYRRLLLLDHPKFGTLTSEGKGISYSSATDDAVRKMLSLLEHQDQENMLSLSDASRSGD